MIKIVINIGKILWVIILLLLGATGIFAYQNYQLKISQNVAQPISSPKTVAATASPLALPSPVTKPLTNFETYKNQDGSVEFQYQSDLSSLITSKQFSLSIKSKQEIIDNYDQYKETGCPSTCGRLVDDPSLLQKQFDILTKVSNSSTCTISTTDKEEIEKDYILQTGGIGGKKLVEGIKTNDGQCGLKIIESDGFDVSLMNYFYKVGFLIDNKIIDIRFNIFPHDSFESVDRLWSNFGYDSSMGCDAECNKMESDYFLKFNTENQIEKEVIKAYDQIISTIKFN